MNAVPGTISKTYKIKIETQVTQISKSNIYKPYCVMVIKTLYVYGVSNHSSGMRTGWTLHFDSNFPFTAPKIRAIIFDFENYPRAHFDWVGSITITSNCTLKVLQQQRNYYCHTKLEGSQKCKYCIVNYYSPLWIRGKSKYPRLLLAYPLYK